MSGNSGYNSGSPPKGFFKRMLGQDQRDVKQHKVKQRHPGFTASNEAAVTPGRMAKPQEVVISPAIRQINREGYVVFNTPEKQDVYIAIQPETAFFDDEEPEMIKMAGGSFVGGSKHTSSVEIPMRTEPESEPMVFTQPADIFSNAARRETFDEIDFNEIIIKKNDSFEEEIEEPVLFRPSFRAIPDPIIEESFIMRAEMQAVPTSTGMTTVREQRMSFEGFREVQDYSVEEVPVKQTMVTDVPAGLYVDGHASIDAAEMNVEETAELSSFIEVSMEAETAMTSRAEPMTEYSSPVYEPTIECLDVTADLGEEISTVPVMEGTSETVACVPVTIDVADPVADIMKLTIPGLHMSNELLSELSQGWETVIPDDGLESYDCIFRSVKAQVKNEPCMASCGSAICSDIQADHRLL